MADDNKLLNDIQSSIMGMQNQMQSTYQNLADIKVSGKSIDNSIEIIMTATYGFVDVNLTKEALQGGLKEFKTRLGESLSDVVKKIQETTQAKTMELLQQMQIPDEIKNMSLPKKEDDKDGGSSQG